jgi:excisionase family DNA binding protein
MNNGIATDRIYTIKEAAAHFNLPLKTISGAIRDHELECYKFGTLGRDKLGRNKRSVIRISQRAIEKWLEHTKQKGIIR